MLEPYLDRFRIPGIAAAVATGGQPRGLGVAGLRRAGHAAPLRPDDRFHIGSDTKAFTATLAGTWVDERRIDWQTTLGATFPELASRMHPMLSLVTLEQLLSHRSGIPSDNEEIFRVLIEGSAQQDMTLDDIRYWILAQWCPKPPATPPGTRYAYSNLGYTLAGAMLERIGQASWEEQVLQRIADPLGLVSLGFGLPSSLGKTDGPIGHHVRPDGTLKPMLAGPASDVPAAYGPAGTIHVSPADFLAWASWNAAEGARGPAIVTPETLRKIHAPIGKSNLLPDAAGDTTNGTDYGLGWATMALPFSPDPFLFHGGSNSFNLSYIMLQPKRDFAAVVMCNVQGENANKALIAIVEQMFRRYAS